MSKLAREEVARPYFLYSVISGGLNLLGENAAGYLAAQETGEALAYGPAAFLYVNTVGQAVDLATYVPVYWKKFSHKLELVGSFLKLKAITYPLGKVTAIPLNAAAAGLVAGGTPPMIANNVDKIAALPLSLLKYFGIGRLHDNHFIPKPHEEAMDGAETSLEERYTAERRMEEMGLEEEYLNFYTTL